MSDVEGAKALFFEALDLLDRRDYATAEQRLRAALAIVPDRTSAMTNLAVALFHQNKLREAAVLAERVLALEPENTEALIALASCFNAEGRRDEALVALDRAIAIDPDNVEARVSRATIFSEQRHFDRAIADYEAALKVNPREEDLRGVLAYARMHACDWSGLAADQAALLTELRAGARVSHPYYLLGMPSTAEDQLISARRYAADEYPPILPPLASGSRATRDRIRVAYISADYHQHPMSQLTAGMFEHHDRDRFETIAISEGPDDGSALRQRVTAAFGRFIDVHGKSDREVANLVHDLDVDIAVDLGGYTSSRPRVLAMRPAPVQVSFLGYPGTMGTPVIDYLIADAIVVPAHQQRYYSEKIVTLPNSYFPNDDARPVSPVTPTRLEADLPAIGFVFCAFNNAYKITPAVFDVWMRLLKHVAGSVLWLVKSNHVAPDNLRREAARRGIAPDRLIFAPAIRDSEAHLARHRLGDLFLDTTHYNAHTTACDALWAGLPVLTLLGSTFPSRVAASLLTAVGLPDLITHSLEEYEQLALKIADDPALLASIKDRLAANRDTTALFDTERFTRHIEAAYGEMYARHQRGEAPGAFAVPE